MEIADIDDIVVFGKNFEEHTCISYLKKIFDRLDEMNLKVKAKKCSYFKPEVQFLGHVVTANGIKTDPFKTKAIRNAASPTKFLGTGVILSEIYKEFCKDSKVLTIMC